MQHRSKSASRSPVSWPAVAAGRQLGLSLSTTACLVAVGWVGHATHWSFGLDGHWAGITKPPPRWISTRGRGPQPTTAAADGTVQFHSAG